eukprot:1679081-Ditylum_brightwellii.AAC.1
MMSSKKSMMSETFGQFLCDNMYEYYMPPPAYLKISPGPPFRDFQRLYKVPFSKNGSPGMI